MRRFFVVTLVGAFGALGLGIGTAGGVVVPMPDDPIQCRRLDLARLKTAHVLIAQIKTGCDALPIPVPGHPR